MPRNVRAFVPGGYYHVYCRVARGEFVFDEPREVTRWVDLVASVSRLLGLRCLAWALMSNHYHLLLQTGTMPLWKAMARLQGRFSREHNRRRGLQGRLWQSRYKARLILDEEQLKHVIAYVHLNPVAAGLVGDPLDYQTSGHRELMGLDPPRLCDVEFCLRCFDDNLSTARAIYLDRLRSVAEARWFREGVRELPWWRIVDDDEQTVPAEKAPAEARDFAGQPLAPERRWRPPLSVALELFERHLGVAAGQLSGRRRTRLLSWYRCLFATFAVSWLDHPAKRVAAALDKGAGSVSRWVAEGLERQLTEPSFRSKLEELAQLLGLALDPVDGYHAGERLPPTSKRWDTWHRPSSQPGRRAPVLPVNRQR